MSEFDTPSPATVANVSSSRPFDWFADLFGATSQHAELRHLLDESQAEVARLREESHEYQQKLSELSAAYDEETSRIFAHTAENTSLRQELEDSRSLAQQARDEADLNLLHLHQIQEVYESCLLQCRNSENKINNFEDLLADQQQQLQRARLVIARLLSSGHQRQAFDDQISLTFNPKARNADEIQTRALLNSYASALQRAYVILQSAIYRG